MAKFSGPKVAFRQVSIVSKVLEFKNVPKSVEASKLASGAVAQYPEPPKTHGCLKLENLRSL